MKLFELNALSELENQNHKYILLPDEFPLDVSEYISIQFIAEDKESDIPEQYKITFVFQEHFVFDIGDFVITILQEDLQNNIPVAYASVDVLDENTGYVIDTIAYSIRFDSKTKEFKHLKDLILANITPTQKIAINDVF